MRVTGRMARWMCGLGAAYAFASACSDQARPPSPSAGATPVALASRDDGERVLLSGSISPQAHPADDRGRVNEEARLEGVTVILRQTPAQKAELQALMTAQLDPASPQYHAWLTPEQYAVRFGRSPADVAGIESWAASQGLTVHGRSRSGTRLRLGGSVAEVERAFRTELHRYVVRGEEHFAPASPPSVPSALAEAVLGVRGMSSFGPRAPSRPHPVLAAAAPAPKPAYTDGSGDHAMAPEDFSTIYDVGPLYAQGFDGTGMKLAIVGQTYYVPSDIAAFRSPAGLAAANITDVFVPNSGTEMTVGAAADVQETELDLEWAGAIAAKADIVFVYTGGASGFDVVSALDYAVDNAVAPMVSISYGLCEALDGADNALYEQAAMEAATQGMTIFASSGDDGAADCDHDVTVATQGVGVDMPAAIPTVTGVGGTSFNEGNGTYWNATNDAAEGSAISYIPEVAWDEPPASGGDIGASGGGVSTLFAKPSWQTGTGVPADGQRDVPDVALSASGGVGQHDGYLVYYSTAAGLPSDGLYYTGGTSAATPSFAAIMTLLSQATNAGSLGTINPKLYVLAASAPSPFHDITTGSNIVACQPGTPGCPTSAPFQYGFEAGPGYDPVTGLGTVDAAKLVSAWEATLLPTSVTLASSASSAVVLSPVVLTASVTTTSASPAPTGSVTFFAGPTALGTTPVVAATGPGGDQSATAALTTTTLAAASYTLTARYSGDGSYQYGTSAGVPLAVTKIATATALAANMMSASEGTSIVLTATLTTSGGAADPSPTGSIVFAVGGATVSTVPVAGADGGAGATATLSLSDARPYVVTAAYSGDGAYAASMSPTAFVSIAGTLAATPAAPKPPPRGTISFVATGNVGAVMWSLATNASQGTIDATTGAYTAGSTGSVTDVVAASDSLGGATTVMVSVGPGVSITPAAPTVAPLGTLTLQASGGSGTGYAWTLTTNASGGAITSGGQYTAGSTPSVTDIAEATDSLGNVGTASVAVAVGGPTSADAGGPSAGDGGEAASPKTSSGCGCRTAGSPDGPTTPAALAGVLFGLLVLARRRLA